MIFAWRHGQRDDSSVRKLAIRIREKITQARKISRAVMTADARAVWKDTYESLSQAKPGLLAQFLTGRSADGPPSSPLALLDGRDQIAVEHLNAALSVWRYFFGVVISGRTEDVIAAALRQAGETGMTRTEIRDLCGRHRKGHEIVAALTMLANAGKAKSALGLSPAVVLPRCGLS